MSWDPDRHFGLGDMVSVIALTPSRTVIGIGMLWGWYPLPIEIVAKTVVLFELSIEEVATEEHLRTNGANVSDAASRVDLSSHHIESPLVYFTEFLNCDSIETSFDIFILPIFLSDYGDCTNCKHGRGVGGRNCGVEERKETTTSSCGLLS